MADQSPMVPPVDAPGSRRDATFPEEIQESTLAVVQETLDVSKQTMDTGAIRVRIETTEHPVNIEADCVTSKAKVSRRAMGVRVEAEYEAHQEDDEWVIPVFEYRPVVTMALFLKEEIRVARRLVTERVVVSDTVRHQRAIVESREADDDDWQEIKAES